MDTPRFSLLLEIVPDFHRLRKIVGMTQTEYAEKVLKIYPRVLMEIGRDRRNPTLETLQKVAAPFGLVVRFASM